MPVVHKMDTSFGVGVYSVTEAARLAHIDADIARRWVFGYGPHRCYQELIDPDIPQGRGPRVMSFAALTELRLAAELYRLGLPAIRIRQAAQSLADISHPFAYQGLRLRTDQHNIFISYEDASGKAELPLLQISGKQRGNFVEEEITKPFFIDVEFSGTTKYSERWLPQVASGLVVLDPSIKFGEPIMLDTRIPTAAVREQLQFGVPVKEIAAWFEIDEELVNAARRFEAAYPTAA
jgi:uncharacterized protein (DUF433 family)